MINKTSLIERLHGKDPSAQRELINKFNSRLLVYFRLRIKGEAYYEDLVQEVFTSFFVGLERDKIESDEFIAPYIFGIAKRTMFNYFYKKKRDDNLRKKSEETCELSYDFEEEDRLQNESLNRFIRQAVNKLPEVDKKILEKFYLEENDISAVADILGKTKHYVSVRKERALKKIKNEILKVKDLYYIIKRN